MPPGVIDVKRLPFAGWEAFCRKHKYEHLVSQMEWIGRHGTLAEFYSYMTKNNSRMAKLEIQISKESVGLYNPT
jgi:hypothetical protein